MIVATKSYETTDPTIEFQILSLRRSGAEIMVTLAIPKFALQAIRKIYDIGWKPTHFLTNTSASVAVVMRPVSTQEEYGHHHGGVHQGADRSSVARLARI